MTKRVGEYNIDMMSKKKNLEEAHIEVQRWLRDNHGTESITRSWMMSMELKSKTDVELGRCKLISKPVIVNKGNHF